MQHRFVVGSAIGLVNSSGSLATQYTYEPFGHPIVSGSSGSTFPYLFAGMEYDFDTILYHTPARYYNPRSGRFVSEDPIGLAGGNFNLFVYAGNDPVNNVDPSGLQDVPGGFGSEAPGGGGVVSGFPAFIQFAQGGKYGAALLADFRFKLPHIQAQLAHSLADTTTQNTPAISPAQTVVAQAEEDEDPETRQEFENEPPGLEPESEARQRSLRDEKQAELESETGLNKLPVDLDKTLDRISRGEPFPHRNDGEPYRNDDGKLPRKPTGYYREYVHPTAGVGGAGLQRVIVGDGGEVYYTADHYNTFIRVK